MSGGGARQEAEERFRLAFEDAPVGMALVAPDGRWLRVNRAVCEILGHPEDALLTKTFSDLIHPDDISTDSGHVQRILAGELRSVSVENRCLHGDGHEVWVNLSVSLVRDRAGTPLYFIAQFQDISERKRMELALRRSEERFRLLLETSNDVFIASDARGLITEWNHQAEETFGWSRDEVVGRHLIDTVIPPHYREAHAAGLADRLAGGEGRLVGQRLEVEGRRRDGTEFPVELSVWAVGSGPDIQFNALLHDISDRRRLEHELWELALVDELTGLHNRRSFLLLAEQAVKEAARAERPVITLFVDVDQMKTINDRHGHAEGDRALRLVADALRAACRSADILGRWGGDEFAIVLTEATEMDGIEGRIAHHMARAADTAGYGLSASVGSARCEPGEECRIEDLLETADQAMYQQKAQRRGTP